MRRVLEAKSASSRALTDPDYLAGPVTTATLHCTLARLQRRARGERTASSPALSSFDSANSRRSLAAHARQARRAS